MDRIAILAGGGRLPLALAESIAGRGGTAHLVGVRGEAGPEIETYAHTWVTWGAVDRIIRTLKRQSDGRMMIAGSVKRPDLMRLEPDFGLLRHLPQVLSMLKGGDDAVLTRLVRFFEAQGLVVEGIATVAPELLAAPGLLVGTTAVSHETAPDVGLGFAVLDALAGFDVGQAVVVDRGRVLAIEGAEGTDRMLLRVAGLPGRTARGGVLVKGPKRGQDLRVDMPTVGADTVARIEEANLTALVAVAGRTLFLDREAMAGRACAAGIAVEAVEHQSSTDTRPADAWAPRFDGPRLGRISPRTTDLEDAALAMAVVARLRPFSTGSAAVVVREHVLAVAASESPASMARRIAALRQWGRSRFRRTYGAAAVAFDKSDPDRVRDVVAGLSKAGLSGVVVVADNATALSEVSRTIDAATIAAADSAGMFLIVAASAAVPPGAG